MDEISPHDPLLSLVETKKTVPTRQRSLVVQTQFPLYSDDERVYLFFPGLISFDQPTIVMYGFMTNHLSGIQDGVSNALMFIIFSLLGLSNH